MGEAVENNLSRIKSEMIGFLDKFKSLSIRARQTLFLQCIMVFDKSYFDMHMSDSKENQNFFSEILRYGYPIFIRYFYDKEFVNQIGIPLQAMDEPRLALCHEILLTCKTIGWIEHVEDNQRYGNFVVTETGKNIRIKFAKKYHWNEYLESQYHSLYSHIMALARHEEYEALDKDKKRIMQKMQSMVSVWYNDFMSYANDMEVEEYFHSYAELDMEQDTDWDMFGPNDLFGRIKYDDYVYSIMDFSGYAIKHYYFAHILKELKPQLLFENLFYLCKTKDDLVKLISENRELDLDDSNRIFECMTLGVHNASLYNQAMYCAAPFIQLSQTQVIQSIAGTLHSPFSFMLQNLSSKYPKEWSINVCNREPLFRKELYSIFNADNYLCIDRGVNIVSEKYGKTDIDAIIMDKNSGEIALFQLKWQGPTYVSARAMYSKAKNYADETNKWLQIVNDWINNSTAEKISSLLGIPKKYIDKNKMFIFVLGRHHANYSADVISDNRCAWGQWYQFVSELQYVNPNAPRISQFYKLLMAHSPFKQKYTESPMEFQIGDYKIIYGNCSSNQ